jgi:sec-independent protein translocase protein TatA
MSFGVTELIIILVIVLLLFGTTRLKSIGSDVGSAIKNFRSAVTEETETDDATASASETKVETKVEAKVEAKAGETDKQV